MKSRILSFLLVAAVAGAAGWLARSWKPAPAAPANPAHSERRILYYQSAMHPWIKSDHPGKCTICGMDLAPIFEGESGFRSSPDIIALPTNSVTVVHVRTAPVRRAPLSRTLRLAGTLDDDDSRHRFLSAYAGGRLDRLFVNYDGAEVREGQPLALLYSPTLLTAVREYLAVAGRAGASNAEPSRARLQSAAASRLLQLGMQPAQIAQLADTFTETNLHVEILSPMTGTVVARGVYEGQAVEEGQKLFELADFSTMWLKLQVYEQDLPWLRPGQPVEFTLSTHPGLLLTNIIAFIDPNFDEATRSTRVRVEVPNPMVETSTGPQRRFRHRLQAVARVRTVGEEALVVPRSAVLDAGTPVVFVEGSDGTYQSRKVSLGRRGDTEVEVLSGLGEGERVVVEGALLLDAQAQLLQSAQDSGGGGVPSASRETAGVALTALASHESTALNAFLARADAVRESLSTDSLDQFNTLAPQLHAAASELKSALAGNAAWLGRIEEVSRNSHLDPAPDLAQARKEFHAFSVSLVDLVRVIRSQPGFTQLKLFECQMTRRAFPGAPARAAWMQLAGPTRNPYFGSEMLDCGTEVKP